MGVHARSLYLPLCASWLLLLAACSTPALPTPMSVAPTVDISEFDQISSDTTAAVPPTWTVTASEAAATNTSVPTEPAPATSTPQPTITPVPPTETPFATLTPPPTDTSVPATVTSIPPTETAVPVPPTETAASEPATDTPVPPPPATATTSPQPIVGVNLLPNPSFEEGHYNSGGLNELQVPNGWIFEWDGGTNPFVSAPDDYYVRPETRVLPSYQIPENEQSLFIFDGQYTMKIFKGYWAINVQLVSDVYLEPGTYALEIKLFPDLVVGYDDNNRKIWAPDPVSGEVRFIVTGAGTDWFLPAFGQRNTFTHIFTINSAQTIRVGAGLRNRYGLMNNGWFIDDWALRRIENP
jgi:hypothetical protein